jgi:hypothetical protein
LFVATTFPRANAAAGGERQGAKAVNADISASVTAEVAFTENGYDRALLLPESTTATDYMSWLPEPNTTKTQRQQIRLRQGTRACNEATAGIVNTRNAAIRCQLCGVNEAVSAYVDACRKRKAQIS